MQIIDQTTIAAVGKLRVTSQINLVTVVDNSNSFETNTSFPTTYSMDRDLLIIEHRPYVRTIVRGLSSTSRDIPFDDLMSVGDEALIRSVDEHIRNPRTCELTFRINQRVHREIRKEFGRLRKRQQRIPSVSLTVVGLDDGPGYSSLRDLRSSVSLNPSADITPGMCEAIGRVRSSAFRQCDHGNQKHGRYMLDAAANRARVVHMRGLKAKQKARQDERASRMRDAA